MPTALSLEIPVDLGHGAVGPWGRGAMGPWGHATGRALMCLGYTVAVHGTQHGERSLKPLTSASEMEAQLFRQVQT